MCLLLGGNIILLIALLAAVSVLALFVTLYHKSGGCTSKLTNARTGVSDHV